MCIYLFDMAEYFKTRGEKKNEAENMYLNEKQEANCTKFGESK